MMNLTTKNDLKAAAAVERRRKYEEERKPRIFDARRRLIGADFDFLQKQVEEKKAREEDERRKEEEYHAQKVREDLITVSMDMKIQEERHKIVSEISEFRKNYQRFEDRREFDLNDKDSKRKSLPARLHDDDPRCTVSSAQKFEGEDLARKERERIQTEQTKAWLEQQIREREEAERERNEAEKMYQAALIARDKRAVELDQYEQDCRRKLQYATARFNRAMAAEISAKKAQEQQKNEEDILAEKCNWINSDLLTENPAVAASNLGPHKILAYMYKGEPPSKEFEVKTFRDKQVEENESKRQNEKQREREFEKLSDNINREVFLKDRELMRKQKEIDAGILQHNRQLSVEQKLRKEHLDKVVYKNRATEAFFDQFNTSTR